MTKVVHHLKEPYDVLIDRTTKWGNPYKIGPDGTRTEVIAKFRRWAKGNNPYLESLDELDGKVLGCWCKPEACHGDVILELIEQRKKVKMLETLFDEGE